jgi:hypothetical protein
MVVVVMRGLVLEVEREILGRAVWEAEVELSTHFGWEVLCTKMDALYEHLSGRNK